MEIAFCISWFIGFIISTWITLYGIKEGNPNIIKNSMYLWLAMIALGWILGYVFILTLGLWRLNDYLLNIKQTKL